MFTVHTQLTEREQTDRQTLRQTWRQTDRQADLPTPQKRVSSSNHLCTGQFSVASGLFQQYRSKICGILQCTSKTSKRPFVWLAGLKAPTN